MKPPQVAIRGFRSEVRNVVCPYLTDGREGVEQPLGLGYSSVEERLPEW